MQVLSKVVAAAVVAALLVTAPVASAAGPQQVPTQGPPPVEAGPPPQSVRVTVVIARYQGETRTSNLPYTLWVNADNDLATLRMNGSVPFPTTRVSQREGVVTPVAQIQYQPVGTQIDCRVGAIGNDRYRISLTVNDSSIAESPAAPDEAYLMPPRTVQFTSTNSVLLRDGETVEYISAADKTTGEIVKLTVSIEVVR